MAEADRVCNGLAVHVGDNVVSVVEAGVHDDVAVRGDGYSEWTIVDKRWSGETIDEAGQTKTVRHSLRRHSQVLTPDRRVDGDRKQDQSGNSRNAAHTGLNATGTPAENHYQFEWESMRPGLVEALKDTCWPSARVRLAKGPASPCTARGRRDVPHYVAVSGGI